MLCHTAKLVEKIQKGEVSLDLNKMTVHKLRGVINSSFAEVKFLREKFREYFDKNIDSSLHYYFGDVNTVISSNKYKDILRRIQHLQIQNYYGEFTIGVDYKGNFLVLVIKDFGNGKDFYCSYVAKCGILIKNLLRLMPEKCRSELVLIKKEMESRTKEVKDGKK